MTDTLMVDPPEGWRYGFPKAVPKDREADILEWLFEQGYPRSIGVMLRLRCWREEVKDGK